MCGQQVLHHVQAFGAVEIGRLAGQTLNCAATACLKPSPRSRAASSGNALQLNDFCTFTHFFAM